MGYVDNWKEEYRNVSGTVMSGNIYFNITGTGNGSRNSPYNITNVINQTGILGAGRYKVRFKAGFYYGGDIVGQGVDQTFVSVECTTSGAESTRFNHLTICGWTGLKEACRMQWSKIIKDINHPSLSINNSIVFANQTQIKVCNNSSIIGLKNINKSFLSHRTNLFDNCTIELTEADITGRKDVLLGFNDCTFKIGDIERKLIGETDEEYRADFYKLCVEEAKITPPPIVDGKVMGNWGFANNSAIDGVIIKGSLLDDFQKKKGSIGYKTADVKPIPLSFDQTQPNSLEKSTASEGFSNKDWIVTDLDGMIKLKNTFPLRDRAELKVSTKVINLHGEKKMSEVNILDNLLSGYGMNISADHSLSTTPVVINNTNGIGSANANDLEIGYKYILRGGKDKDGNRGSASFTYNGVNYSTSLGTSNIVPIVADKDNPSLPLATFTNVVGLPELYKVRSHELYQTLEMRIVDEINPQKITSGSLASEYWYIVEGEEGGSVIVDNVKYPVDCSFLVRGDVKGVINSVDRAHLKKCFKEDYNRGDDAFYNGKQQPVWFKVVGNDMRCQHLNNSIYDKEMAYDEELKTYIASGHPHFYYKLKASDGFRTRAFPIKGRYVQFRLHVSSFNVM